MSTEPTKEEISLRSDLQSLRDRGWNDEQLIEYARANHGVKLTAKSLATMIGSKERTANG